MSRPARDVLWICAFFLLQLLLVLTLRSRASGDRIPPPITGPTTSPLVQEDIALPEAPAARSPDAKESSPPTPGVPRVASSPASALVVIHVADVYGIEIKEPGLNILTDSGGLGFDSRDDRITKFRIYGAEARIRILCGDLDSSHQLNPGDNLVQLTHGNEFGELAIKPAEWEKVQIRPKGNTGWKNPTGVDPGIGRRFLFLTPGEYEVSDHKGFVAGTAVVVAGRRTPFTLTRLGAIRLDLSFVVNPEPIPPWVPIKIRGITVGASHPEGYGILMMTKNNQWSYVQHGLEPGGYEVTVDEATCRFAETLYLKGGEVRRVDVRLASIPGQ